MIARAGDQIVDACLAGLGILGDQKMNLIERAGDVPDHGAFARRIEDCHRFGILHHVADFGRGQAGANGHDDAAGFQDGGHYLDHRDGIRHMECDPIADFKAQPLQRGGEPCRTGLQLGEAEPSAATYHRFAIRRPSRGGGEHGAEIQDFFVSPSIASSASRASYIRTQGAQLPVALRFAR